MRVHQTAWLQPDATPESQNSPSVLQVVEQAHVKEGNVVLDYEPDVDYKPGGPDPSDEPDTQEKEY